MNSISDFNNYCALLCNLSAVGHLNTSVFSPISVRSFESTKFTRKDKDGKEYRPKNMVVEKGISWADIESSGKSGKPYMTVSSFKDLVKILAECGGLKETNPEAKDLEGYLPKAKLSFWHGDRTNQDMVSVYVPTADKPIEAKVDHSIDFLKDSTKPVDKPVETQAEAPVNGVDPNVLPWGDEG